MNLGERTNFGNLIDSFGWNKGRAKVLLWTWSVLLLFSLPLSLILLGLPCAIASIYFVYRSLRRLISKKPIVSIYERGLIDDRGGSSQIINYQDIKNVYISIVRTVGVVNYIITLETHNKKKIKIDEHVANIDVLRQQLEQQIVRQQFPATIAAYQSGETLVFNSLQVHRSGLSVKKKTLPWSEFGSASIQQVGNSVFFVIYQRDKEWMCFSRNYFPNIALFCTLTNYISESVNNNNYSNPK
jgi:hypothetical protein